MLKLLIPIFAIFALIATTFGQEEKGIRCYNSSPLLPPKPIECPHRPNKCPQYRCTIECDSICVYEKSKNTLTEYINLCNFCQVERCNIKGAFEVPLSFCRKSNQVHTDAIPKEAPEEIMSVTEMGN